MRSLSISFLPFLAGVSGFVSFTFHPNIATLQDAKHVSKRPRYCGISRGSAATTYGRPHDARWSNTRCCSSNTFSSMSSKQSSSSRGPVLFQKFLRNRKGENGLEFLGALVAWLQDGLELPPNIPMLYDKQIHEYKGEKEEKGRNKAVITWNSALSPDPAATALHVDVVAVYPENNGSSMLAMVLLSKEIDAASAFGRLPPMMQNLYRDAEKRIIKDLDRAFMHFQMPRRESTISTSQQLDKAKRDMLGELMEEMPSSTEEEFRISNPEILVDAEVVETSEDREPTDSKSSVVDSVSKKQNMPSAVSGTDFAVQAAQSIVRKREEEGYAVQAARKVAQRKKKQVGQTMSPKGEDPKPTSTAPQLGSVFLNKSTTTDSLKIDPGQCRPPSLSAEALASRSFAQTISRPQDHAKRAQEKKEFCKVSNQATTVLADEKPSVPQSRMLNDGPSSETTKSPNNSDTNNRNVNIVSEETTDPVEKERLRLANEALNEVAQSTDDVTADEMLEAVMEFGDAKKKEETVGEGFVSGAFEKAKELLREQQRKRDERYTQNVATKVVEDFPGIRPNIKFDDENTAISAKEELRRMFEAGEKLADSRISHVYPGSACELTKPTPDEEKLIDEVVASNRDVSSFARVLDDELVQLEMRINKSPEEAMDGERKFPVFDIFSGPELYCPNVDPETAVNWPGALLGTKTTKSLPQELAEAVKQAKFAANVLSKLEEKGEEDSRAYFVGERRLTHDQVEDIRSVVDEASNLGLISDPLEIMEEKSRLQMIIDEVWNQPEERFRDIVYEYKDLLLSDHFVGLVKERLRKMADRDLDALRQDDSNLERQHEREREILGYLVASAQVLLKETQALGAELEAQQLEVIRSICKVAMDPSLQSEEETAAALSDAVRDMRPLFDDAFVAYLKYAVSEEEARLARAGVMDDPDHAQWLYVLKIVQQGVYNEISRGLSRFIDHISYVLRMETPKERRMLLSEIIEALPTLDVRPFVKTVENIAGALGDTSRGNFDAGVPLGEMTNKILQLHRDAQELLPPEKIAVMSRDADEWAKRRRRKLIEQRKVSKQRLRAAQETEHLEGEINAMARKGEMERFD